MDCVKTLQAVAAAKVNLNFLFTLETLFPYTVSRDNCKNNNNKRIFIALNETLITEANRKFEKVNTKITKSEQTMAGKRAKGFNESTFTLFPKSKIGLCMMKDLQ